MGKASTQKKVARAATTGGGRTAGVQRPMGWYLTTVIVVAFGVFLVAFSRNQELNKGQVAAEVAPKINSDSWNSSFSVYICDHWAPAIPLFETVDGIDSIAPGVIHIQPFTARASGKHDTLSIFFNDMPGKMKVSKSELQLPKLPGDTNPLDAKDWKNGDHCPNGKAGTVKFNVNGKQVKIDPSTWALRNGDNIDLAFLPSATDVPANPSEKTNLSTANQVSTTPPTTAAPAPSTSTATTTPTSPQVSVSSNSPVSVVTTPGSTPATTPASPATSAP